MKLKYTNFIFLTISGLINSLGVILLLSPAGLLDGGLSGTSLFLSKLTPPYLTISMFLILLNFPFFLFARKKLGNEFIIYSLYAIALYSFFAFALEKIFGDSLKSTSPIAGNDTLLCAVFGGLLSGIGSGITIRYSGALDGIEVMAIMFAKKLGLSLGTFVMIYNVILYLLSGIIESDFTIPLYSIITYFVGVKTIDLIVDGIDRAKNVMIITSHAKPICEIISNEFKQGLTIVDAKGYYSNTKKEVIYCVVNHFEIPKLKRLIKEADPQAFVVINDTSDVRAKAR